MKGNGGKRKKNEMNDETGARLFLTLLHHKWATTLISLATTHRTRPVKTFHQIPHLCRSDGYFSSYTARRRGEETPVG